LDKLGYAGQWREIRRIKSVARKQKPPPRTVLPAGEHNGLDTTATGPDLQTPDSDPEAYCDQNLYRWSLSLWATNQINSNMDLYSASTMSLMR